MLSGSDSGSTLPLVIGYLSLSVVLLAVGVDVTAVLLARHGLAAAADTAALAAAQGVDTAAVYTGSGLGCGQSLPLDEQRASTLADSSFAADSRNLRRSFATLAPPRTTVNGGDVEVSLSGAVTVPFGAVLGWLDPAYPDGRVQVAETAHAQSPVVGDGTC